MFCRYRQKYTYMYIVDIFELYIHTYVLYMYVAKISKSFHTKHTNCIFINKKRKIPSAYV